MNKLIIASLCMSALLAGCKTPDYGADLERDYKHTEMRGIEVLTINGYAVEVTEDNIIRVKVPRKGDLIKKGIYINEEGVIEVALASITTPLKDQPLAAETNQLLNELLLGKEVTIELTPDNKTSHLECVKGYVSIVNDNVDYLLQDILIRNGLAIIDKSTPFIDSYINELENLQTAALNEKLGVWGIEGLVHLSDSFDAYFTDLSVENEKIIKQIVDELKAKGWSIEKLLNENT